MKTRAQGFAHHGNQSPNYSRILVLQMNKKERTASLNEAKVLSCLSHPNVIHYIDSFLSRKTEHLCIVMEWAEGGTRTCNHCLSAPLPNDATRFRLVVHMMREQRVFRFACGST